MNGSINGADDPAAGRGTPAQAPPWLSPAAFWDQALLALTSSRDGARLRQAKGKLT
jgi:hypothetical protein